MRYYVLMSECIPTDRALTKDGYGATNAKRFGKKIYKMHRLAWIDAHGQLPPSDKPHILHTCDNPACVNPDHLYAGTHLDNMRDREKRGRGTTRGLTPMHERRRALTHCPRGHEYAGANLYINPAHGGRVCRTCGREATRKYLAKKKATP